MDKKPRNNIILCKDENELANVSVRFTNENLWLSQKRIAEIFDTSRPDIAMHIKNTLNERELDEHSACKDFLLTTADGKNHKTMYYSLDMVYRAREMRQLESGFDRAVKDLVKLDQPKCGDKEAE